MTEPILARTFYETDAVTLASSLLGKRLWAETPAGTLAGIITETEAYCGVTDRASHAYGGRRTARTETMYLPGGYAYVYLIYGLYACLNVTAAMREDPQAVLIREILPSDNLPLFHANWRANTRAKKPTPPPVEKLANGPGRLCSVMGITRAWNGIPLTEPTAPNRLWITDTGAAPDYTTSPRVGIDYAGEDRDRPWRFILQN